MNIKKLPNLEGEEWTEINFKNPTRTKDYLISNWGRIKAVHKIYESESEVKATMLKTGFLKTTFRLKDGCESIYPHRMVAEVFVEPESVEHNYVIHKDMNRRNNHHANIEWVTEMGRIDYIKARAEKFGYYKNRKREVGVGNYKLTEAQVAIIKKQLETGKTRKKMIAKRFGVTTTQINRIEQGVNWAWVEPAKDSE